MWGRPPWVAALVAATVVAWVAEPAPAATSGPSVAVSPVDRAPLGVDRADSTQNAVPRIRPDGDRFPSDPPADLVWDIRGTHRPLPRHGSAAKKMLHGALMVPYAAIEAISWPVYRAIEWNERYRLIGRLFSLVAFRGGDTRVGVFFGYESRLGPSVVGLQSLSDNYLADGATLELKGGYLNGNKAIASLRYRTPVRRLQLGLYGRYRKKEDRAFYGVGPDAPGDRFGANRQRLLALVDIYARPLRNRPKLFYAVLTVYARKTRLFEPSDEVPVDRAFPKLYASAREATYVGAEWQAVFDARDRGSYSSRGALVRLGTGYNSARSTGDPSYANYSAEVQAFFNLYRRSRTLAFRAYTEGIDASEAPNVAVPYNELSRLGGKVGPRGYARYRLAGADLLLLTLEYRYRATQLVTGHVFADWGTVAPRWDLLRLADVDPTYGVGVSFGGGDHRVVAHVARGPEGNEYYLGTERVFEFRDRRLR